MRVRYKHTTNLADYIQQRVRLEPDGCVTWLGGINHKGYGVAWDAAQRRFRSSHRLLYSMWRGSIPEGLQLDHKCRNRICCNPDHLEPVTPQENTSRGLRAKGISIKSVCTNGHGYAGDNVVVWGGVRYCRACVQIRKKVHEEKLRNGEVPLPKPKAECRNGHLMTGYNVGVTTTRYYCRACVAASGKKWRLGLKAKGAANELA